MEYNDKIALVTGGTGSIGRAIALALSEGGATVRIFSRDEFKQHEMSAEHPGRFQYFVGDVRDEERLREAMWGADYVFHTAALKQVPSCELSPMEAFKTNCLGSQNVCSVASNVGVEHLVAISTDKAVNPDSAMGITKAMMERIVCSQNQHRKDTVFSVVRCGNVLGSRGSVVPLFERLIAEGKPLRITDPNMTRFVMTPKMAADLALMGLSSGGGEILLQQLRAVTIGDLATAMLELEGEGPRGDYPIEITGARAGERSHDALLSEPESYRSRVGLGRVTVRPDYANVRVLEPVSLERYSSGTAERHSVAEIVRMLSSVKGP